MSLAAMTKSYPRTVAVGIGIVITLLILSCLEIVFLFLNRYEAKAHKEETYYSQGYWENDQVFGYRPASSVQAIARKKLNGSIVYNIKYSIDEYHRRQIPVKDAEHRDKFALFFGCSFTFGEGVQDNETLPFNFSNLASEFRVYNYGFQGYGPQSMLAKLQTGRLREEIREKSGILIYLYLPKIHEKRVIGSMYVYNKWGSKLPYYRLDSNNALVKEGNFTSGRPFTSFIYKILGKSQLLKYFNIDFPVQLREQDYMLTARVIEESQREFKRIFGENNEFYVVIYPNWFQQLKILPYLQKAGIKYFNYSSLFNPKLEPYKLKGDPHPTPLAYQILAEKLAHDITSLPKAEE